MRPWIFWSSSERIGMTFWATIKSTIDRRRRDERTPAIIIIAMVVLGCFLSLFGAILAEEAALLLVACAAGLFATLYLGGGRKER